VLLALGAVAAARPDAPGAPFTRVTEGRIAVDEGQSRGVAWGDADGDGDLDLYVANTGGQWNFFYRNDGGGRFAKLRGGVAVRHGGNSEGATWADVDNDGDLDLFVANWGSEDEENALYRNEARGQSWIVVRPEGRRSNRMGIGLVVRVKATIGGRPAWRTRWLYPTTGYGSQSAPEVHVGLGSATVVDSLVLTWPSGAIDTHTALAVDRVWRAVEGRSLEPASAAPVSTARLGDHGRR
jgi:hypothetical protein